MMMAGQLYGKQNGARFELFIRRGQVDEQIGYRVQTPEGGVFVNEAMDLMCYADDGTGFRQLQFGERVPTSTLQAIGAGHGNVEYTFKITRHAQ